MSIRVKIASTPEEIDGVFLLRHAVFTNEGYMQRRPDGRIFDRFDAYPSTANIVACDGDKVVGTVRYMEPSSVGASTDEYFDFRRHLPDGAQPAIGSYIVLEERYRGAPRVSFAMAAMGFYWAKARGLTHVIGVVNPDRAQGFLDAGFETLAAPIRSERIHRVAVLPVIAELRNLDARFLEFIERHEMNHWLSTFEREFFDAGETLMRLGEHGSCAHVIMEGRVELLDRHGQQIATAGKGELLGELALITDRPRIATVRALEHTETMVVAKGVLQAQLRTNPIAAEKMIALLANRAMDLFDLRWA